MPFIFEYIGLGVTAVVNALIAAYVFARNPGGRVHKAFLIFVGASAVWAAGLALLFFTQNFFFNKVVLFGALLMVYGLLVFALSFPTPHGVRRRRLLWLALPLLLIAPLIPFDVFIEQMVVYPNGRLEPVNGRLFPLYIFVIAFYCFPAVAVFIRRYIRSTGLERLQMRYLFLGAAFFVTTAFLTNAFLPALGIFHFNLLGPTSSVVFIGCIAYAIVKHQLMDIRIVIQRGVIYTFLAALVISLYLASVLTFGYLLERATQFTTPLSAMLTTLVGVFSVPWLDRYLRKKTDHLFFKDRYEYSDALHNLSESLNRNFEVEKIIREASALLRKIFKTDIVEFVILDDEHVLYVNGKKHDRGEHPWSEDCSAQMARQTAILIYENVLSGRDFKVCKDEKDREELLRIARTEKERHMGICVPLSVEEKPVGFINLGEKLSGDSYTEEDFTLLRTYAYEAAVALEKAELFKQVEQHSRVLEERVKERTRDLQTLQEEQRRMMMDISHALQTPLTVIRGKLEMLKKMRGSKREGELSETDKELQALEASVYDVSVLVYDLLRLASLEGQPSSDWNEERVNLSKLVEDFIEDVSVVAEENGIAIASDVTPDCSIGGDKKQLKELVTNLVGNAMKYIGEGERKEIFLGLSQKDAMVEIVVKDSGIGIDEADLPHIFDRFYRGKSEQHRGIKGAGLGLAISKKIVEKHKGTIVAESKMGRGTTFRATFPVAPSSPRID